MDKQFIKTSSGTIPLTSLPIVKDESITSIAYKCALFYFIIITVIIIMFYMIVRGRYETFSLPGEISSSVVKKVNSNIKADSIYVYNPNDVIPLENIIIIDTKHNMIDIDLKRNPFVKKIPGLLSGITYQISFKKVIDIKEVGFISADDKFIKYVNITLMLQDKKVWYKSVYLKDQRENFIPIQKYNYSQPELLERPVSYSPHSSKEQDESIIITNNKILGIKLMEDSEEYVGY